MFSHYDYSMKRIYIRLKGKWIKIGFMCPFCLRYEIENVYLGKKPKRRIERIVGF